MRYEQSANETKAKRMAAKAQFDWASLMRDSKATFEQREAAAQKLRESVRVGARYRFKTLPPSLEQIEPAEQENRLKCRRYAPGEVFWPEVLPSDWCGEFEEKRHD